MWKCYCFQQGEARVGAFSEPFAKFCWQLYRTPASPGHSRDFRVSFIDTVTTLHCLLAAAAAGNAFIIIWSTSWPRLWSTSVESFSFHAKLLLKVVEDSCHHNYLSCCRCPSHDHVLQRHFLYYDLLHVAYSSIFANFCLISPHFTPFICSGLTTSG